MNTIVIDGLREAVFHNGVLRVECMAAGQGGALTPSGTLVIPAAVATQIVQGLAKALQELDQKVREKQAAEAAQPN